ncbi:glycosyltransferase family 4 protein [Niabella drilacis]|uniref:Glycosyltransferase involved in cell wall bisynthesis n=1 Tax=Niabella drilacis (strain DSM 25811 / CCM 8410 / CCUG 62505 / LMG 26954 / E90) TaxID=1285928 RepID=A0A1G6LLW8_NIADE|nr:glycosyltransferase family 4 protein [Niabella drilacis]SDC44250.1 Glycosyltransferase involved in cell wall bisynthesis [Niabella drilacis]
MNILHLLFSMRTGGIETMLVDIVQQQSLQHKVSVAVINDEIDESLVAKLPANVQLYRVNRAAGSKSLRSVFKVIRLNRMIFRNQYDIVHCHSHPVAGLLWPGLRKKAVLTLHITDIESKHFGKYRKIYAISSAVAQDLKRRTGFNAIVVCNGIDVGSIMRKKAGMVIGGRSPYRIVQIGRLDVEKKGQDVLIEAIYLLKIKGIQDVYADFIGEGASFDFLRDLVKKRSLDAQISFLGLRDRTYIYTHLKDYDLLVQPSFVEGFGLTIVESMAAKTPVLVSDIEGPMEVIENGKYGSCFEKGNVSDLAEKLEEIIKGDRNRIAAIAEKACDHVKELYSIQRTASGYLKEYACI